MLNGLPPFATFPSVLDARGFHRSLRPSARRLEIFAADCLGAAAIEIAFIFPVFILMVFGIVELSRAFWIYSTLSSASAQAARCYAIAPTSSTCSDPTAYAATLAASVPSVSRANFSLTSSYACVTGDTSGVQITATYTFTSVVAQLIPSLASTTFVISSCQV